MLARTNYIVVKSKTVDDYNYPATRCVKTLFSYAGNKGEAPFYVSYEKSVYDARSFDDMNDATEIIGSGKVDAWEYDTREEAEARFEGDF